MPSTYSYGIRNRFRPTALAPNAYAWSTRPQYQRADVPTALMGTDHGVADPTLLMQQFAYEWFQSGQIRADYSSPTETVIGGANLTNPPFVSGASGRLLPSLRDSKTGQPARILRGFIRRADFNAGDSMSRARLYFMYNPETITREYVSYLNQAALDPFNTVFQSGNLVPPPSFMDFSFNLFFDRQEEAAEAGHPGVFVDYQFFDLVVRNVVPTDPNQNSNTLPDNGVMMVNPRDITVVFSPQITVQGRPLNATVSFERFTHRMVPTRMLIKLTMRVIYIGPMRDNVEYRAEQLQAEVAIPYDDIKNDLFPVSFEDFDDESHSWWQQAGRALFGLPALLSDGIDVSGIAPDNTALVDSIMRTAGDANDKARKAALSWAINNVQPGAPSDPQPHTDYVKRGEPGRTNLPDSADCSGLVTMSYVGISQAVNMGWTGHPGTDEIIRIAKTAAGKTKQSLDLLSTLKWQWQEGKTAAQQILQPGDLLIHGGNPGHVVFFVRYEPDSHKVTILDAASSTSNPEVGMRPWGGPGTPAAGKEWYLLRPSPIASTSVGPASTVWNNMW